MADSIQFVARPISIDGLDWGREYSGQRIEMSRWTYAQWMLRKASISDGLRAAIRAELGRRIQSTGSARAQGV